MSPQFVTGRLPSASPPTAGERFEPVVDLGSAVIELITSSAFPDDAEQRQAQHEWVVVLSGSAELLVGGTSIELETGSWMLLPAGTPHRVVRTAPGTRWLAVHVDPGAAPSDLEQCVSER